MELLSGTVAALFDFIASRVLSFAGAEAEGSLGFTFSFACAQQGLDSGVLLCWTKGFALVDGPGQDVVALLRRALAAAGSRLRVAVLVNDTVGTLAASHFGDSQTRVGVILGTGTNAAYVERCSAVGKWAAPAGARDVVVNIEWGGLDVPSLPRLPADAAVDAASPNVGQQALEKMLAGMYLGKISALSLLALQPPLFDPAQQAALRAGALSTPLLSAVVNDASPGRAASRAKLEAALGGALSDPAFAAVAEAGALVSRRSARLAAAVLAAVLTFSSARDGTPTVAVDGGAPAAGPRAPPSRARRRAVRAPRSLRCRSARDAGRVGCRCSAQAHARRVGRRSGAACCRGGSLLSRSCSIRESSCRS